MNHPNRPFVETSVLAAAFVVAWLPAKLLRYFADFPEPIRTYALNTRHTLGNASPYFEHFAGGLGLPILLALLFWPLLYWGLPKLRYTQPTNRFGEWLQTQLMRPSIARDLVLLALPSVVPVWRAWEWELCQAKGLKQCAGGNPDGTLQYDQLLFDHLGAAVYLIFITAFVLACWVHASTESRRSPHIPNN